MITEDKKREYVRRLILSRIRLLNDNGFFGLLLMHAQFALDIEIETAATDGEKIFFSPDFMDELSDSELDFVLMHEIMHVALRHCIRTGDRDPFLFNIACDIVVNSNILLSNNNDRKSITIKKYGESMHLAPDNKEGYEYTVEEVYEMLLKKYPNAVGKGNQENAEGQIGGANGNSTAKGKGKASSWDYHGKWKDAKNQDEDKLNEDNALWNKRIKDSAEAIEIRKASTGRGTVPLLATRKLKELKQAQTDWRTIIDSFVQEEIVDYSFAPPDRRFEDSPFFLPDFNEKDIVFENVLFMIDTSGSMSDDMVTQAYSEVKGAIDQFDGKLKGLLGFFDAEVIEPQPFCDEDTFKVIQAKGGGGTSFDSIFNYVNKKMQENPPASIIILTDGYAPFPPESASNGIPVLWLINNEEVTPPWGKIARIK